VCDSNRAATAGNVKGQQKLRLVHQHLCDNLDPGTRSIDAWWRHDNFNEQTAMNKPYAVSAKAVVRDSRGRCLVLRRSGASKNNAGFWEFPGGKIDPVEHPDEALVREIREETGLNAQVIRVVGAGESELPDRKVAYLFFEARVDTDAVQLSSEHDAFQWVERSELKNRQLCPQFMPFAREYSVRSD